MNFESLLLENKDILQKFIFFKIPNMADAQDIYQEVCLTAYQKFSTLEHTESFKPWLLQIARNKCRDYFRKRAKELALPVENLESLMLTSSQYGLVQKTYVHETLDKLGSKDQQILYLYYLKGLSQKDIAERLKIPCGTVKSRLFQAKKQFKKEYAVITAPKKGKMNMKELPTMMPHYTIQPSNQPPFSCIWEELMGWMIIPRLNEKISWAAYDYENKKRSEYKNLKVIRKAEVHGIEGVEIEVNEHYPTTFEHADMPTAVKRTFIAQLTNTHCRYLAEQHIENGVRKCSTFLDGSCFLDRWGFGENNCGKEIHLSSKGFISRNGNIIQTSKPHVLDIAGRYTVTINDKVYDTVCIIDTTYQNGIVTEQYVDKAGRTVLWRRFNSDKWMQKS